MGTARGPLLMAALAVMPAVSVSGSEEGRDAGDGECARGSYTLKDHPSVRSKPRPFQ